MFNISEAQHKLAIVFLSGKTLQPSLMSAGEAGAYPGGVPFLALLTSFRQSCEGLLGANTLVY
jgi:hypothetical protein